MQITVRVYIWYIQHTDSPGQFQIMDRPPLRRRGQPQPLSMCTYQVGCHCRNGTPYNVGAKQQIAPSAAAARNKYTMTATTTTTTTPASIYIYIFFFFIVSVLFFCVFEGYVSELPTLKLILHTFGKQTQLNNNSSNNSNQINNDNKKTKNDAVRTFTAT